MAANVASTMPVLAKRAAEADESETLGAPGGRVLRRCAEQEPLLRQALQDAGVRVLDAVFDFQGLVVV